MYQPSDPQLNDDIRSLAAVVGSAVAALLLTGMAIIPALTPEPAAVPTVTVRIEAPVLPAAEPVDPAAGADRIYGAVRTVGGEEVVGYLRWNGSAASWADVLQATEPASARFAGVRFGRVARLERVDARTARVTLKGGEVVELAASARRGDDVPRALEVQPPGEAARAIPWVTVETVELLPEPLESAPASPRLHGTVTTRSGLGFTGYLGWHADAYVGDALEGLVRGEPASIAFESIASVVPTGASSVRVVDVTGAQTVMGWSPEVGRGMRGVTVSDPGLGTVVIPRERLREVRFHPPAAPLRYEELDGGRPLVGTVTTEGGEEIRGRIAWDRDEAATWQTLDGIQEELRIHVDFGRVRRIAKYRLGARVTLDDGRTLDLLGSNDVNWNNRGILIRGDEGVREVSWREFSEVRFDPSPAAGSGSSPR